MIRKSILTLLFCAIAFCPAQNLLRGLPATLEQTPDYHLTRDARDKADLTDGKWTEQHWMWTNRTSVGWYNAGPFYSFYFDFGTAKSFNRVRIHCGAGKSGVKWPEKIYVCGRCSGYRRAIG